MVTKIDASMFDAQGKEIILDADADTSITADTDDQIDIKIAGADDFSFKANTFEVQTGSNIDMNGTELILDANGNTSITADTDDQIDIKIAGADDFRFTANNFNILSGSTLTVDSGATLTNSGTATGFADFTAIGDGSVGSPSLANSGDTNTGIYWPGADQLGLTTAGAAAMLISATGGITKPLQPMFHVMNSGSLSNVTGDGTDYTIIWSSDQTDVGNNVASGVFTVPITGNYLFTVAFLLAGLDSGNTTLSSDFICSGSDNSRIAYRSNLGAQIRGSYFHVSGSFIDHFTAAETVHVNTAVAGGSKVVDIDYSINTHFSGYLLG